MAKVLLIAPSWVNLHIDIRDGLVELGHQVDVLPEYSFKRDPLRVHCRRPLNAKRAERVKTEYWQKQLQNNPIAYDYLFVIDGQGVNQTLFDILKQRNPDIYCICYLYDTTYSRYKFNISFKNFDKVYTFDKEDARNYQIGFLPIYWLCQTEANETPQTQIFGCGAYSRSRYRLYSQIKNIADELGLEYFINLYYPEIKSLKRHAIYLWMRRILGMKELISTQEYKSDLITHDLLSTQQFRKMIAKTDTVLDTKVQIQTGLTARFMWALGAGKKIITTNDAVKEYNFYSDKQILVVRDGLFDEETKNKVKTFLTTPFVASPEIEKNIIPYRIDNWLNLLLAK